MIFPDGARMPSVPRHSRCEARSPRALCLTPKRLLMRKCWPSSRWNACKRGEPNRCATAHPACHRFFFSHNTCAGASVEWVKSLGDVLTGGGGCSTASRTATGKGSCTAADSRSSCAATGSRGGGSATKSSCPGEAQRTQHDPAGITSLVTKHSSCL